jgi:hypothetical protein
VLFAAGAGASGAGCVVCRWRGLRLCRLDGESHVDLEEENRGNRLDTSANFRSVHFVFPLRKIHWAPTSAELSCGTDSSRVSQPSRNSRMRDP